MESSITPWEEAMNRHIVLEKLARYQLEQLTFWDRTLFTKRYKEYITLLCEIIEVKQIIDQYADVLFPKGCKHNIETILQCQIS
jgi:hypothetical protein